MSLPISKKAVVSFMILTILVGIVGLQLVAASSASGGTPTLFSKYAGPIYIDSSLHTRGWTRNSIADAQPVSKTVSFTIISTGFNYTPNTITVNQGDTVQINWINNDTGLHDICIDPPYSICGAARLPGGAPVVLTFVATTAGQFTFYCSVKDHRAGGMVGTLIVQAV